MNGLLGEPFNQIQGLSFSKTVDSLLTRLLSNHFPDNPLSCPNCRLSLLVCRYFDFPVGSENFSRGSARFSRRRRCDNTHNAPYRFFNRILSLIRDFREALLHRHPTRLSKVGTSSILRSPRADFHEASLHRNPTRLSRISQLFCFNGLCTPFGSPVIGGQKRLGRIFAFSHLKEREKGQKRRKKRIKKRSL